MEGSRVTAQIEMPVHEVHFTMEESFDLYRVELRQWADGTFTADVYQRGRYADQYWEFNYDESPQVEDIIDSITSDAERRFEQQYAAY
jgi:hypothetical protein